MAKTITDEQKKEFREWCRAECEGDDENSTYFSVESCPVTQDGDKDGESLWVYHDTDGDASGERDTTYDVYELFESVNDEFYIEEDGWDSFIVTPL